MILPVNWFLLESKHLGCTLHFAWVSLMIVQVLTLCQCKLLELFFITLKFGLVFEFPTHLIMCEHFECIIVRSTTRHSSEIAFLDMLLANRLEKVCTAVQSCENQRDSSDP